MCGRQAGRQAATGVPGDTQGEGKYGNVARVRQGSRWGHKQGKVAGMGKGKGKATRTTVRRRQKACRQNKMSGNGMQRHTRQARAWGCGRQGAV